jgi:hypothetical protein
VYPSISKNPAALLSKLDNCALRLQEEKVLGVGNREGGISLLGAVCDLTTDGADENLQDGDKLVMLEFTIDT